MGKIDPEQLKKHQEMEHHKGGKYLHQFIFGTEDGLIGNLGLITGVTIATLDPGIVILSGIALMLTQAVSMGAGTFLSVRSQREYHDRILEQEMREIKEVPDIEREEVRQIYQEHGFKGKELDKIVKMITSNDKTWVSVMMAEEFGFTEKGLEKPSTATIIMTLSVMLGAIIPILPFFLISSTQALYYSFVITIIALFVFGASKTTVTKRNWVKSGLEMMIVGLIATTAGYLIGNVFTIFSG